MVRAVSRCSVAVIATRLAIHQRREAASVSIPATTNFRGPLKRRRVAVDAFRVQVQSLLKIL